MLRKKELLLCAIAALSLGISSSVCAEETITLRPEDKDPVVLVNTAMLDITGVSVTLHEEDEDLADVILLSEDGTQYEFDAVKYTIMKDPELVVEGAFAYIKYISILSGKESSVGQTGELNYEEAANLFAVDDVYIRSEPDSESEILGVINRGDEIEVLGETASYYIVKKDDVTGYTVRKCISEDEQEAIAAVQAEEAERARIQAEAAAAAAAAQQAAASQKQEVSRQKYEDCDGSGHGYYVITYSDGSTKTVDY